MKWGAKLAAAAAILSTSALGGWACADDSGGELTLEEYFQQLEEADSTFNQAGEELFSDPETDDVDVIREAFGGFPEILDELLADLDELNPPEEAQEAHDAAVEAGKALSEELDGALEEMEDADTRDELIAVTQTEEFTAIDDRFTSACANLQRIADDNEIEVSLSCRR